MAKKVILLGSPEGGRAAPPTRAAEVASQGAQLGVLCRLAGLGDLCRYEENPGQPRGVY